MKYKTIIIILYLTLNVTFLHSQSEYKKGYVVLGNDTIKGYIFYGSSRENSERCKFLDTVSNKKVDYYPTDIKSYKLDNSCYYVSREINLEGSQKKVFLEFIVKGKVNFYFYIDEHNLIHYYFEKEGDSLFELHNSQAIIKGKDEAKNTYLTDKKEYIGELTYFFRDYPEMFAEINKSNFNTNSFIKIAKNYHDKVCNSEECMIFERPKRMAMMHFGIIGEYCVPKLSFKNATGDNYLSYSNIKSLNTSAEGLYFEISDIPLLSKRISLRAEFIYIETIFRDLNKDTLFDINQVRASLQLKYSVPFGRFRPGFSIGVNDYFRIRNKFSQYIYADKYMKVKAFDLLSDFKNQFGLNCRINLTASLAKMIEMDFAFRYDYNPRFIGFPRDPSFTQDFSIQLGLGYRLP